MDNKTTGGNPIRLRSPFSGSTGIEEIGEKAVLVLDFLLGGLRN